MYKKVAVAKPSATAALSEALIRFHSATALTLQAPEVSMMYNEWKFVKLEGGKAMVRQLLLVIFDLGLLSHECGY